MVAAPTTSLPERPLSGRNSTYRPVQISGTGSAALIAHRGGRGHCGGFGGSGHMGGFGGAPTEGRGSPSAGQNRKARRLMLVSIVRAVLVISASALVTAAEAQQPVVGTGVLVAPHISAPPPHISPSAPAPVPSLAPHLIAPPTTGSPRPTYGSVPSSRVRSQGYIPEVSTTRHYHMLISDQGRDRNRSGSQYSSICLSKRDPEHTARSDRGDAHQG